MSYASKAQGLKPAFYVAKSWHKCLAGPQGSNIKKAQQTYHFKIIKPPRETEECGIVVDGKLEDIQQTKTFFEQILGFEIGADSLIVQRFQLTTAEIDTITGNNNFTNIIRKHGMSVLFPNKDKNGPTIMQGRSKDIQHVCNELSKILNHQLQIFDEKKDNTEEKDNHHKITHHTSAQHDNKEISEVLFFHPFEVEDDEYDFNNFLEYLLGARHTIDICEFTITDDRIRYVLDRQKKNGVKIRVLTDNSQALTFRF